MGSTRLPGKVMMSVGDSPMLQLVCDRLKGSSYLDELIVATTDQPEDDVIHQWCIQSGVGVFRGSDWDVLSRFYGAATTGLTPDIVVRICCDSPTQHAEVVDYTIQEFRAFGTDYFSNGNQGPYFYEDGLTSEVFSFHSLEKAFLDARLLSEREHVTPFIKNSGIFSCAWRKFSVEHGFKLSVDTTDDLEIASSIFQTLGKDFTVDAMFAYIYSSPDLRERIFNKQLNTGYFKSLSEDQTIR
jgi:spore coat polysaccharide biosynthesis protein SpsF (cytidylyltransferase family)